ncbi:MAG TPA: cation:dicarboxylase symporter family transporter, partial [Bdellovibrionales bacterium]|nr:cation:dicarboxylase symporter family transporter [Bdellovibrionales bacterium]
MTRHRLPLLVLVAVVVGVALGTLFPDGALKSVSEIGKLIIHWVKLIAGPFLFLTIVASVVEVQIRWRDGLKLVGVALFNTSIAIALGVGLASVFLSDLKLPELNIAASAAPTNLTLSFDGWVKTLTPSSLFAPFVNNDILLIALMALLTALALRKIYSGEGETAVQAVAEKTLALRKLPATFLEWMIAIIPLAVCAVVAGSVSQYGLAPLVSLLKYVAVVLLGLTLQVVLVYGTWLFIVKRISPKRFWAEAKEPIFYALGVNSSLATVPLTFKALKNLGVSPKAASLGAGVATNLNNDGVVLYEAMAVFFIAGLYGIPMTETQMITAALACIVASMGITGVPEAGFISLSVVVGTLGLPAEALPLLLAVDWMIA